MLSFLRLIRINSVLLYVKHRNLSTIEVSFHLLVFFFFNFIIVIYTRTKPSMMLQVLPSPPPDFKELKGRKTPSGDEGFWVPVSPAAVQGCRPLVSGRPCV